MCVSPEKRQRGVAPQQQKKKIPMLSVLAEHLIKGGLYAVAFLHAIRSALATVSTFSVGVHVSMTLFFGWML